MNININITIPPMDKNELAKFKASLSAFGKQIVAGQHQHRLFHIKTKDEYLIELLQVYRLEEAIEIFRLCEECAMATVYGLEHYVQGAITDIGLGFSQDYVRYELYQTCMSNRPPDELQTGEAEEQFFK